MPESTGRCARARDKPPGRAPEQARITLDPPQRAQTLGFPVTVRELAISFEEPDAFLAAVGVGQSQR